MNKFHFNEHKRDTWKYDWLISHIIYIRSMDVGGYSHNYEGFYEKSIYQMCTNKRKTTTF